MAFKDYEEIVDKCCDAWNDIWRIQPISATLQFKK
nr:hypothetical protein [uncultured Gammaproteobacteria bacterium]